MFLVSISLVLSFEEEGGTIKGRTRATRFWRSWKSWSIAKMSSCPHSSKTPVTFDTVSLCICEKEEEIWAWRWLPKVSNVVGRSESTESSSFWLSSFICSSLNIFFSFCTKNSTQLLRGNYCHVTQTNRRTVILISPWFFFFFCRIYRLSKKRR